jgi:acetylornithine deacetylase/succinyl-diaminopimelate desuccinylase-like protein
MMKFPVLNPEDFVLRKFGSFASELAAFVNFPSISAQPQHTNDVRNCAIWLARHLSAIGMHNVNVIPTKRHPLVYADWLHARGKPTLLIYGHYDVQPVDPLNEWKYPPFKPIVENGFIHGRGASDDKGQLFAHLKALEFYLLNQQRLPINIKCLFEGEEEIGSPGLEEWIAQNHFHLKADGAVVSDMRIPSTEQPAITYSLRGMLALEITVTGQKQDIHSGTFGGAVYNPIHAVCDIVTALHDENGQILIPGFYDSVHERSGHERKYMKTVGQKDDAILRDSGAEKAWGEKGFTVYERTTIRPSISVNGIKGGYQGDGPKAIIPSTASAKISFRLVPEQDPKVIEQLFREYVQTIAPKEISISIKKFAAAKPVVVPLENPFVQAATFAYRQAFGQQPIFLASGGTIPIVNLIQEQFKIPVVLMGFALPTDNIHGPNERFSLANFYKGILTSIYFLQEISSAGKID